MKKQLLIIAALSVAGWSYSQQGDGGVPRSYKLAESLKEVDQRVFASPDVAALQAEDQLNDSKGTGPWRFGFNNATNLTMQNAGTWTTLPNGSKIWRLQVTCENALTVNLTLDNVLLPEGNELYVYNPDKSFILGAFKAYHLYEGNLGTELVPGNTVVLEYYIPKHNLSLPAGLRVNTVTHGYRTAAEFTEKAFGTSGDCNMNVNCTDGADWVDQRNSAVMLVSGSNGFCSGALINNTENDGKPYVLTANHCYGSGVTNWVFRFNWQASACSNPGASPSFQSLSGAVLRSRRTPSDFCLVEITGGLVNNTVPEAYNPYFSGWDNSGAIPTSSVCIHHPDGDIKKISFDDAAASISQAMGSSEAQSTWTVEWDRNTTTEGGSSGSPLFDQNHRIIGQLWGGGASCSNLSAPDYYGRLNKSWEPAGSNSTNQLKFWLDPDNSGVTTVDGYNPFADEIDYDAGVGNASGVTGRMCTASVTPQVTITNNGSATLVSATITYGFDGNITQVYNWAGSLAQFASETVTLPAANPGNGDHTFEAVVSNPNGNPDGNAGNNTVTSSFTTITNGEIVDLALQIDCFGSETSWELQDADNSDVLYTNEPYVDNNSGELINVAFCLEYGCYKFIIEDEYGDGLTNDDNDCNVQAGWYTIEDDNNTELAGLTTAEANFGDDDQQTFCLSGVGIGELEQDAWSIYPNPASQELKVDMSELEGDKTLVVMSTTGQIVWQKATSENKESITVSGLAKGVYFISLTSPAGKATRTFIVR